MPDFPLPNLFQSSPVFKLNHASLLSARAPTPLASESLDQNYFYYVKRSFSSSKSHVTFRTIKSVNLIFQVFFTGEKMRPNTCSKFPRMYLDGGRQTVPLTATRASLCSWSTTCVLRFSKLGEKNSPSSLTSDSRHELTRSAPWYSPTCWPIVL